MDGLTLTPLKRIYNPKGDIFHALKQSEQGFCGFGEAYFSTVNQGVIKGWKKHTKMTLNLIVLVGAIKFVIYKEDSKEFFEVVLSPNNYQRLTISPNLWVSFTGVDESNILLNIASIEHNPLESINLPLESIKYEW